MDSLGQLYRLDLGACGKWSSLKYILKSSAFREIFINMIQLFFKWSNHSIF